MRILLYTNSYLPEIGGRELVVHNLALQFQALGHEVLVAGPAQWRKYRHLDFGYPLQRHPVIGQLPSEYSRLPTLLMTRLFNKFDIVHAHSTYPMGYVATKVRRLLGCPIVITPHGEDVNLIRETNFGMRLDPVVEPKIRFAVNHADCLTAISATVEASLLDLGVAEQKLHRVPNGVDIERFGACPDIDFRKQFGIPSTRQLITTVGNYHHRKGHEVLVESMNLVVAANPEAQLVVVGRTSPQLTQSVSASPIANNVTFTGEMKVPGPNDVEPDLLVALLRESQIFVSSSIAEGAEGLPLSLLEAMAAHCAPVVTRISGNRDVVAHEVNGLLVEPSDAIDLGNALVRLLADPQLTQQLATKAFAEVTPLGWAQIAAQYIDVYASLLDHQDG